MCVNIYCVHLEPFIFILRRLHKIEVLDRTLFVVPLDLFVFTDKLFHELSIISKFLPLVIYEMDGYIVSNPTRANAGVSSGHYFHQRLAFQL